MSPPSNPQASSVHDNLEKKPRFFHLDLGFGVWQRAVETLLCHLDGSVASGCILPQPCHACLAKYMSQHLPSHPQPQVPQGQGFSHGAARERAMIHATGTRPERNCL